MAGRPSTVPWAAEAPLEKPTLPEEQTQLLASFLPFLPLQNTITVGGSFPLLLVQLPKATLALGLFCKLHLLLSGIAVHAATLGTA